MILPIELPTQGPDAPLACPIPGKLTPQGVLLLNQVIAEFREARGLPVLAPAVTAPPPRRRRKSAAADEPSAAAKSKE